MFMVLSLDPHRLEGRSQVNEDAWAALWQAQTGVGFINLHWKWSDRCGQQRQVKHQHTYLHCVEVRSEMKVLHLPSPLPPYAATLFTQAAIITYRDRQQAIRQMDVAFDGNNQLNIWVITLAYHNVEHLNAEEVSS